MKLHITVDQIKELKKKEQKKLWKWWVNTIDHCDGTCLMYLTLSDETSACQFIMGFEDWLPLLSVGQMIEFLESRNRKEYISMKQVSSAAWLPWEITMPMEKEQPIVEYDDEICDALWNIVKEILKRK